jgi:hypothetical protein
LFQRIEQMKLIFGFALMIILVSCSGNQKKLLGKWSLEKIDYSEQFENSPEEIRELLKQKMDEEFERLRGKTFFIFNEDMSLELLSPDLFGKIVSDMGTYRLNKDQDSVYFETLEESYKLIKLESSELVLQTDDLPKRTLYLKKQ